MFNYFFLICFPDRSIKGLALLITGLAGEIIGFTGWGFAGGVIGF
jgi:hypothetical protein